MKELGPETKVRLSTVAVLIPFMIGATYWFYQANEKLALIPQLAKDIEWIKRKLRHGAVGPDEEEKSTAQLTPEIHPAKEGGS